MKDFPKKVELLANLAIIVVAALLAVVLVSRYLLPSRQQADVAEAKQVRAGTKLSLPGADWGHSDRTLLLVLSTTCRYCTESAPFYQRLAQEKSKRGGVRLMAVLPQSADVAQQYLADHGITVDQVKQAAPGAAYAKGTPTLILVDNTGSVVGSWVGKLPPEKEAEVLSHVLGERAGN
jgi:thioredoxin-related protein